MFLVGGLCSVPVAFYFGVEDMARLNSKSNYTKVTDWTPPNSIRKCRDLFPNQTARTTYFVLVFLLTYLLPFMSIIIMNYMIVSKLRHEVNQVSFFLWPFIVFDNSNFRYLKIPLSSWKMTPILHHHLRQERREKDKWGTELRKWSF